MPARIYAVAILALVSAVMLMLTVSTGATFTAPTANPSNQIATATLVAPTGVTAPVQSNGGTVRVAWTATTSTWANGHRVYRATSAGGPYTLIQQIAGLTTVSYDDAPGLGTFYYVVRGYYNANGANWDSADSVQASAKTLSHFTFNTITAQHSGSAFSLTVTARSQDGSANSSYNGTVALSVGTGTISPTSATMTDGSLTLNVTITGAYTGNETITVTAGSPTRTGTTNTFTLNHFRATAVAITNRTGGAAGRPESGDKIVLTFSEAANIASVGTCNGSTTSGTNLTFTAGQNASPDVVAANGTRLRIGSIALGDQGYVQNDDVADSSTCAWSLGNTVLTITLQGLATWNTATVSTSSTATWTPSSALTSATGEAIDMAQKPAVTAVLF